MGEERKKSEIRVESEGTVAEHISTKKEKKKKSRESKDSFAGEDGETAAREREKLGEDALAKKKSEKKSFNSEADDDVGKNSKKRNKEKRADSEADADGVKKSEKKRVDSEADDDGVKKSRKKNKEKKADSEAEDGGMKKSKKKNKEKKADSEAEDNGVKKSKKKNEEKSVDSEAEDDGVKKSKKKKKSKKESGGDEIGNSEENQSDGKSLVNTDDAKKETGKRKRDDSDLGAEENTENSDKEIKRISKKKKPCVDSEVEENSLSSAKDAKKKSKEKKPCEDPEVEENIDSTKDAKKKPSENSEAEENDLNSTKDAKKKRKKKKQSEDSEAEENNLISSENAKKKGKNKKQSENPEAEENNKDGTKEAKKTRKKKQKCSKSDEDVTTPSSKSTKKVKFSDQVEVFPAEDEESEEEEEEEVELVRGKRFTKEEDELIKKAVLEYIDNHALGDEGLNMVMDCKSHPQLKGCWKEITAALPWRPHSGVYHRAHTIFEEGSRGVWSKEDFEFVIEFQKKHGNDWRTLADAMGKHRKHVKDAWRRIRLASRKKGNWSRQEYQTLFDLVNKDIRMKAFQEKHAKHGMLRDNIPWMAISDQLETRDHVFCCTKWYDQLQSPMVAKGIWANVDDYRLMDELTNLDAACVDDVDWDNLLDNRDGEACRKRWDQMVRNIGLPGTKTFAEQVEILSQRYCPDIAEDREDFDNRPFDPED